MPEKPNPNRPGNRSPIAQELTTLHTVTGTEQIAIAGRIGSHARKTGLGDDVGRVAAAITPELNDWSQGALADLVRAHSKGAGLGAHLRTVVRTISPQLGAMAQRHLAEAVRLHVEKEAGLGKETGWVLKALAPRMDSAAQESLAEALKLHRKSYQFTQPQQAAFESMMLRGGLHSAALKILNGLWE